MKLFLVLLLCSLPAAAGAAPKKMELSLEGGISKPAGFAVRSSVEGALRIPIFDGWQVKLAEGDLIRSNQQLHAGADYNFDEDWMTSFFLGGGIGWQQYSFDGNDDPASSYFFGYAEAGKRFPISRAWGLNYEAEVECLWGGNGRTNLRALPVGLSVLF